MELEENKTEVYSILDDLRSLLAKEKKNKKLTPNAKREKVEFMRSRIKRSKDALRSFRVELREFSKVDQKPYLEQANEMEEKIKELENDLDWWERDDAAAQQEELAGGVDHIISRAEEIQTDDKRRVSGMVQTVAATETLGAETLVTMKTQTEQLVRIDEGIDEVASNIKLARRHMRTMFRRMATDKIILGFIFLIFVGVLFIIIWSATHPNSKGLTKIPPIPTSTTTGTTGDDFSTTTDGTTGAATT